MDTYLTRTFFKEDPSEEIDVWLNEFAGGPQNGFKNDQVVGYVGFEGSITITIKIWESNPSCLLPS